MLALDSVNVTTHQDVKVYCAHEIPGSLPKTLAAKVRSSNSNNIMRLVGFHRMRLRLYTRDSATEGPGQG